MARYLVTGATGFVGPQLVRLLLQENHNVYALIRGSNGREEDVLDVLREEEISETVWQYGDLCDYASLLGILSKEQLDGVFHLAAQSHPPTSFENPVKTFKDNVIGTVNLLDVIGKTQEDCKFMFCSTSEVYGNAAKSVGVLREDMHLTPANPYGASKAAMDLYVQERCRNGFLNGYITRAFSHTGPRRGKNFSISSDAYNLALMKKGMRKSHILPVGNLESERVVIDVRDVVKAYYLLMQCFENGEAYNVCGPKASVKKMGYFTDKLIEISKLGDVTKEQDSRYYRDIDIEIQIGSTAKLEAQIDWKPTIPIEETLEDLFNYWMKKL